MSSRNPFEGSTVFKNAKTFDQGWTPDYTKENETLPCRDEEIQSLTALYRPIIMEDWRSWIKLRDYRSWWCRKNGHYKIFWSYVPRCPITQGY